MHYVLARVGICSNGYHFVLQTFFAETVKNNRYLAAITRNVELATGVLVLPQRQTALVAKQAAEVDVLSGGRLVLAVGTGWNPVEDESLGMPFTARGRRLSLRTGDMTDEVNGQNVSQRFDQEGAAGTAGP